MSSKQPVNFVTKTCGTHGIWNTEATLRKKVHIRFSAQLIEPCVAKQTGSIKTLTTQGNETMMGKCNEQKCRQKALYEFFVTKRVMIHHVVPVHI